MKHSHWNRFLKESYENLNIKNYQTLLAFRTVPGGNRQIYPGLGSHETMVALAVVNESKLVSTITWALPYIVCNLAKFPFLPP